MVEKLHIKIEIYDDKDGKLLFEGSMEKAKILYEALGGILGEEKQELYTNPRFTPNIVRGKNDD